MRYILWFLFLFPCLLQAKDFPEKPTNYVTDETNSLTNEQKNALNQKLHTFEDSTSNQIFIYLTYSLNGKDIQSLSQNIFHVWQIGKKGKNNGILISVFVNDHKFRIQTGYGLEGALPDLLTKHIQDNNMRPSFKTNKYYEGIDKGVDQLIYYSKHEFNPDDIKESNWGLFAFFYLFAGLFLLITLLLVKGLKDRPTAKKVVAIISIILFLIPFIGAFLLIIMLFIALSMRKDLLKSSGNSNWTSSSSDSSWSSSSSSDSSYSSSSSSDFGGGGGGDSGGGGSSSDW